MKAMLTCACAVALSAALAAGETVEYQIGAPADDATASAGSSGYTQSTLYSPYSDLSRVAFWRWAIQIPKGAVVESAYVWLRASAASASAESGLELHRIDCDTCPAFAASTTFELPVAGTGAVWRLPVAWSSSGGPNGDGWYRSPNVAALVQAALDRPGYQPGNYFGLRGRRAFGGWKTSPQFAYGSTNLAAKLEITYSGGPALIDLIMADPEVRIAQKITCRLTNVKSNDALRVTLDGRVVHSATAPMHAEETFVARYGTLQAGNHQLTVQVLDSAGNERGKAQRGWRTLHDGIPRVGINENNAICTDGKPFFPITSWLLDASKLTSPIGTAVNTLLGEGYYATHDPGTFEAYLSAGRNQGLKVAGPLRWGATSSQPITSYVARCWNNEALLAWMWRDEPDLGGAEGYIKAPTVRSWTAICHSNDTGHPVWVNYSGYGFTDPEGSSGYNRMREYCYLYNAGQFGGTRQTVTDIVGIDYYPYEYGQWYAKPWISLEDCMLALDRVQAWNAHLVPAIAFIETQDIAAPGSDSLTGRGWTPGPTPQQLQNLLWLSVIHGAKGVSLFHYFCPTPQENIDVLRQFKSRIADLTAIVLGPERKDVFTCTPLGGGRIDATARVEGETVYVLAANTRDEERRAVFTVSSLGENSVISCLEPGRALVAQGGGSFEDVFPPFGVRIYTVSPNGVRPCPPTGLRVVE